MDLLKKRLLGIMGNIQAESDFITDRKQNGGPAAGLFQWESYTGQNGRWLALKNYADSQGKDWTDIEVQCEFALDEMDSVFSTYSGNGGNGTYITLAHWRMAYTNLLRRF